MLTRRLVPLAMMMRPLLPIWPLAVPVELP